MAWKLIVRRCIAYAIDIVLLFAVLAPVSLLVKSMFHLEPETGLEIWRSAVLSFSIPVWLYFTVSDASSSGATVGKRLMRLSVARAAGDITVGRALARTAVKLLPWELAHIFGFALANILGEAAQLVGLTLANVFALVYFVVCAATRGARSVHDLVAGTAVVQRV